MSAFELPPEQAERLSSLGEPVASFKSGFRQIAVLWLLTALAFAVGLGVLAFVVGVIFLARGPGWRMPHVGLLKFALLGLVLLGFGVGGIRRIWRTRGLRVLVFEEGLARLQGGSIEALRWEDIRTVRRASLTGSERTGMAPARKLILTGADGREFEFDEGLSGLRELRELVEQRTLPHLFPAALDAWEAGEQVSFGKIDVERDGLRCGRLLAWAECENVEVAHGMVTVKAAGAWLAFCKVPLQDLYNVHVLFALTEYVRKYAS
jgi:hypothetical protein